MKYSVTCQITVDCKEVVLAMYSYTFDWIESLKNVKITADKLKLNSCHNN